MAHSVGAPSVSSEAVTLILAVLIAAFVGYGIGTSTADFKLSAPQTVAPTGIPDWHGNVMRSNH